MQPLNFLYILYFQHIEKEYKFLTHFKGNNVFNIE